MKNKKGFVTISLVLWLSFMLTVVVSLYAITIKKYNVANKLNRVKEYKKNYAYYDVIEEFQQMVNIKLLNGELEDSDIKRESYFLETDLREYKVANDYKTEFFILEVKNKGSEESFRVYYKHIMKSDGSIFFIRRTVGD